MTTQQCCQVGCSRPAVSSHGFCSHHAQWIEAFAAEISPELRRMFAADAKRQDKLNAVLEAEGAKCRAAEEKAAKTEAQNHA